LHYFLRTSIDGEIGRDEDDLVRFKEMLKAYVPKATAQSCKNMLEIFDVLEDNGRVAMGDYSFLIDNIFKPSDYKKEDILSLIEKIQEKIQTLLKNQGTTTTTTTTTMGGVYRSGVSSTET